MIVSYTRITPTGKVIHCVDATTETFPGARRSKIIGEMARGVEKSLWWLIHKDRMKRHPKCADPKHPGCRFCDEQHEEELS